MIRRQGKTLEDLVDILEGVYLEVKEQGEVLQMDLEVWETPTEDVCICFSVIGSGNIGDCVGTGEDGDKRLVVSWDNHFKVIEMLKERLGITEEDEEEGLFNVEY